MSNSNSNVANYDRTADWGGQDGNVTSVGACGAPSFYGTYDQSGNVAEWTESRSQAFGAHGALDQGRSLGFGARCSFRNRLHKS